MLLSLHIVIAIFTICISLVTALKPNQNSIKAAKYSIVATLLSGAVFALASTVSIGHLCASGLTVVGICSIFIAYGARKLAFAKS